MAGPPTGLHPGGKSGNFRDFQAYRAPAMEEHKLDSLPVIDAAGRFVGTVERAKLATSLILVVTEKLSEEGQATGKK